MQSMATDRSRKATTWQFGVLDPREESLRLDSIGADLLRRAAAMLRDPETPDAVGASELVRAGCLRYLPKDAPWRNRAHLLTCTASAARRLFADRSRNHKDSPPATRPTQRRAKPQLDLGQIDRALTQFACLDTTMALAFELRLFACCSTRETARFVGLPEGQFRRRWKTALVQLARCL